MKKDGTERIVTLAKGIGAREIVIRIGATMDVEEWRKANIQGILSAYLKEIGE